MTAIVSRERARATWLTGAVGLLLLTLSAMMMAVAAPSAPARPSPPAPQKIVVDSGSSSGSHYLAKPFIPARNGIR